MLNRDARPLAALNSLTTLLEKYVEGQTLLTIDVGQPIQPKAEDSNAIYFIASGQIKITVTSHSGKEAVLALLGAQEFFREGCCGGHGSTMRAATALEPSRLLRIDQSALLRAIRSHFDLRAQLMDAVLLRNMAIEEDLCDQIFNQSEKRLARALLKMARSQGNSDVRRDTQIPALSHGTLAEMIGTSRPYITRFMTKFRRMGLIDYSGYVHNNPLLLVRTELLSDAILQGGSAAAPRLRSAA